MITHAIWPGLAAKADGEVRAGETVSRPGQALRASWAAGSPSLVTACAGHQTLINPVGEPGDAGDLGAIVTPGAAETFDLAGVAWARGAALDRVCAALRLDDSR